MYDSHIFEGLEAVADAVEFLHVSPVHVQYLHVQYLHVGTPSTPSCLHARTCAHAPHTQETGCCAVSVQGGKNGGKPVVRLNHIVIT